MRSFAASTTVPITIRCVVATDLVSPATVKSLKGVEKGVAAHEKRINHLRIFLGAEDEARWAKAKKKKP